MTKNLLIIVIHLFYMPFVVALETSNSNDHKTKHIEIEGKSHEANKTNLNRLKSEIANTMSAMTKTIGLASCTSDQQCQSVAVGQKACGGPQTFLAFSTNQTNVKKLNMMAKKHRQLSRRLNKITRMNSDCLFLTSPKVICRKNRCRK